MSTAPVKGSFKIAKTPNILRLAEVAYAAIANLLHQCFHIGIGAVIIHHFNLHEMIPGILAEYAPDTFGQVLRTVIRRYHHRPKRTMCIADGEYNGWRFGYSGEIV